MLALVTTVYGLDPTYGAWRVMIISGALSAAGVIPADANAELLTMAAVSVSRAQVLGLGYVSADDVSRAMEG